MSRTRAVLTTVALLSALALSGCTDDDPDPKFAPPSSSAPTSPSSASTTAAAALSPEDTVRAWVDAQNEALRSGDSREVRSLGTVNCRSCDGLIDPIDSVYAAGGHFETSGWTVDRAKEVGGDNRRTTVNAAITIAGGETVNAAGEDPVPFDVDRSIMVFKLLRDGAQWQVSFIGFLS